MIRRYASFKYLVWTDRVQAIRYSVSMDVPWMISHSAGSLRKAQRRAKVWGRIAAW